MIKEELIALQTIYAAMLEHGQFTTGKWSYYSSYESAWPWCEYFTSAENFRLKVIEVGVDWSKTRCPDMEFKTEFVGTFAEAEEAEYLVGDLYLNDGSCAKLALSDFGDSLRRAYSFLTDSANSDETNESLRNKYFGT